MPVPLLYPEDTSVWAGNLLGQDYDDLTLDPDITGNVDATTITTTTSVSPVENAQYVEAAIIVTSTVVSGVETRIVPNTDGSTIITLTLLSSSEIFLTDIDASTIETITQITTGELEYLAPSGWWGPFDDDNGII
jgi:hypothetical protein